MYGMMYLFVGYDQCPLHVESQDMTTFNSPLGPYRCTTLLMGHTNTVQIYQADMAFILQEEIPHHTMPFINNLPIKTETTRHQNPDRTYQTIPENPSIRTFIWKHLTIVHRILQRLQNVSATVSAKKFILAAPDATIIGHKCTFEGRIPHELKVQKIRDWPECETLTQVQGFLGTYGVVHIFIHDFAAISRPLVNLTRKGVPFEWGDAQHDAIAHLKDKIIRSPALRWLDYASSREVVLAVDTSLIAVGFILSQEGEDGKHYPNRFCSISLMSVKSRYSQAKLKLYGLSRVLCSVRVFIFGVTNLVVELDAKYVKGMINNPNLQPNATINRWIAGILLFHFELCHVSAEKHAGPDGLSRRPHAPLDTPKVNDVEGWLDDSYSFCITLLNDRTILFDLAVYISSDYVPLYHLASLPLSDCPFLLPNAAPHFPLTYATVFTSSHSEPVSAPDSPVIPRSPKALVKEAQMRSIRGFLDTREHPTDLTDAEFQSFVNSATKFFLLHSALWRREPHSRHQQVAPEGRHYGLIREAHDNLGHKGVFTVQTCLLLRFWWQMLVDDVKWFIRTCHECQVCQTQRFHIPPTVPIIGRLFRKVHIDTMLMPRSGGYR